LIKEKIMNKVTLTAGALSAFMALQPAAASAQQTADGCILGKYNALATGLLATFEDERQNGVFNIGEVIYNYDTTRDIANQCHIQTGDYNSIFNRGTVTIEIGGSKFIFEGPP
jgi:opacity protein-like surface antigen